MHFVEILPSNVYLLTGKIDLTDITLSVNVVDICKQFLSPKRNIVQARNCYYDVDK